MLTSLVRSLLVHLYSLVMSFLFPVLRVVGGVNPKLAQQLEGREGAGVIAKSEVRRRGEFRRGVVFFCSSAGEYEQAKPLLDRLSALGTAYLHVIFFSKSGYAYAKARNETVPFSLAASDSIWSWGWLFAALRPDLVVVVRHELWPGFLHAAKNYARVFLIDASRSLGEASSRAKRVVRGQLFRYFDKIYVVSEADKRFFKDQYQLTDHHLLVAGDTKYDRAVERTQSRTLEVQAIRSVLNRGGAGRRRLVVGSAHLPDLEAVLAAHQLLGEQAKDWQLVVAPHHVDPASLDKVLGALAQHGLSSVRYTDLESSTASRGDFKAIVVDRMGLLAEVYGSGELAFVGGAMHHQVHNVLEPASHGLALGYGPFYKNSQEAEQLVDAGLAAVCADAAAIAAWWRRAAAARQDAAAGDTAGTAVARLTGAADRIMQDWKQLLDAR